jgi:hypothetical protein
VIRPRAPSTQARRAPLAALVLYTVFAGGSPLRTDSLQSPADAARPESAVPSEPTPTHAGRHTMGKKQKVLANFDVQDLVGKLSLEAVA